MLWNALQVATSAVRQRLGAGIVLLNHKHHIRMTPQIASLPMIQDLDSPHNQTDESWIWFAVPKSKVSRSRKRMKTTSQKKIPLKKNIVFDPRTGEVTLKHKLPFNWKDYLPKVD
eukprot:scaffold674_cov126-Cylindrotheca_fusiformis.AAC.11